MTDGTVYTDLSYPSGPDSAMPPHLSRGFNSCQTPRRLWIALWIGWVGNAILFVIVLVLVLQVGQLRVVLEKHSRGGSNGINESNVDNKYRLRQYLCMSRENTTESSSCNICPPNWYLHEMKCYWISTNKLTWNESLEDCSAKLSQMAIIQNQDKKAFIQNINKGNKMLWIGLRATSPERKWTWVDGSPFDDELSGGTEVHTCGRLNENKFHPEACVNPASWICEKEALFL